MAAGADDNIASALCQKSFVFLFNDSCADGSFLSISKAESLKGLAHTVDTDAVIVCNEGRRKAYVYGITRIDKHLGGLAAVSDLLSILGTYYEALAAEDTFVADYMSLVARKANAFYGTVADTFIEVFTV